jgi:AraC family transcriptional regulator
MYPSNVESLPRTPSVAASALALLTSRAGDEPDGPIQQLRSLVAELFTALRSTLNDERDSAEDSLGRAAAILRAVEAPPAPAAPELKGGLAPWQIRKVTSHIEGNLDKPLKSADLAEIVRLSAGHFSRSFRNSFGCSPIEYVIRRRMEHAQGLMLSTDVPLSQIALDCGLADQAHLSRLFRRVVGESPRSWRRARVGAGGDDSRSNVASSAAVHPGIGAARQLVHGGVLRAAPTLRVAQS